MLDNRRTLKLDQKTFEELQKFIQSHGYTSYNMKPITEQMYDYFQELYRLNNIKKTLATTFFKIKELKTQIDANQFSITYSNEQIIKKTEDLEEAQKKYDELF